MSNLIILLYNCDDTVAQCDHRRVHQYQHQQSEDRRTCLALAEKTAVGLRAASPLALQIMAACIFLEMYFVGCIIEVLNESTLTVCAGLPYPVHVGLRWGQTNSIRNNIFFLFPWPYLAYINSIHTDDVNIQHAHYEKLALDSKRDTLMSCTS